MFILTELRILQLLMLCSIAAHIKVTDLHTEKYQFTGSEHFFDGLYTLYLLFTVVHTREIPCPMLRAL